MKQLLTDELRAALPALYATEEQGDAAVVLARFFTPDSYWNWFAVEFNGEDIFFGLVEGHEIESGYFSLAEMAEARGPWGLPVERDEDWEPRTLGQVTAEAWNRRRPRPEVWTWERDGGDWWRVGTDRTVPGVPAADVAAVLRETRRLDGGRVTDVFRYW